MEKKFIVVKMEIDMKVVFHKKEGQGVMYYKNGNREMGDYSEGKSIGKHVVIICMEIHIVIIINN